VIEGTLEEVKAKIYALESDATVEVEKGKKVIKKTVEIEETH